MLAEYGTSVSPDYAPLSGQTGRSSARLAPQPLHPRTTRLADLRLEIDRIERQSLNVCVDERVIEFGDDGIDRMLPWSGLPRGVLHEVVVRDVGAGLGFVAAILGRLAASEGCQGKQILWCQPPAGLYETGNLYAPALAAYGLDPGRVLVARGRRDADIQWAMEEGLRCQALFAVVGQVRGLNLTSSRRLQLAARRSGVTAFLLMLDGEWSTSRQEPSAAVTRWRVASMPADGLVTGSLHGTAWQLELVRCRGGLLRQWRVVFDSSDTQDQAGKGMPHVPGCFRVAAEVCDRSPESGCSAPAAELVVVDPELAIPA